MALGTSLLDEDEEDGTPVVVKYPLDPAGYLSSYRLLNLAIGAHSAAVVDPVRRSGSSASRARPIPRG
eukprot:SAG31_NODE_619_length_13509_cov_3.297539_5_plen_68_part_00